MRCPDCNKFVSMENGEPEVEITAEYSDGKIMLELEGSHVRQCADCGTELKSVDLSESESLDLTKMNGWEDLSEAEKEAAKKGLAEGSLEIECEVDSAEADESGGARYQKNIITVSVQYSVKVVLNEDSPETAKAIEYSGTVQIENPASAYEECC